MPYGLKIEVAPGEVDEVREYSEGICGKIIVTEEGIKAEIVKADIRERKGKAVLLIRYSCRGE